jgi:hypothetical protein
MQEVMQCDACLYNGDEVFAIVACVPQQNFKLCFQSPKCTLHNPAVTQAAVCSMFWIDCSLSVCLFSSGDFGTLPTLQ